MKPLNTVPSRVKRNASTQCSQVTTVRGCEIPVSHGEGIFCRKEPAEVRIEIVGENRPARVELSSARRYCPEPISSGSPLGVARAKQMTVCQTKERLRELIGNELRSICVIASGQRPPLEKHFITPLGMPNL